MDYRRRIAGALKELAAGRGLSGVTVDELAAYAGISKRTIYRYFRSKEEIVRAVVEEFLSTMERKIQQALDSEDDPVGKITALTRTVTENKEIFSPLLHDLYRHYPHLWEKIERFRAGKIQQTFESLLSSGRYGCFRQVDPKIFTAALISGIRAVINPAFIMENNLRVEEAIQSLFTIYLYGIVKRADADVP
ncbi:transcriptional regulator [Pelotomaculum thermopropionicum SI]|uniref:Transcriptional regulator n=1 Tax=Pelotomaculum thermopropionicum (strain DSM 13744 / JCM 10971 / SI) TaxID=370438 RepID=A5D229_PELTS|nr:transcriptional regulator [Pelotomaculum thermopropionicum SI]